MPPTPQILIVAPNVSARHGGEAFIPLKYFELMRARGLPVRLVTHARNRPELAGRLGPDLDRVDFLPETRWHGLVARRLARRGRLAEILAGALLRRLDARAQDRAIRARVAAGEAEVIHQPIPVSPLIPSALHGYGVPVVIGPMNGGMTYPPGYGDLESARDRRLVALIRAGARVMNRLVPGKRRAAVLLVANARTRAALPCPDHPRIETLVENGVDFDTWAAPPDTVLADTAPGALRAPGDPGAALRLVFMGRLVGWKAVDITLQALARARAGGVAATLEILGDGSARAALEAEAARAGLGEAVRFAGFLPQADCAARLAAADALILNSVWECGGAVVLEAMAMGLPVIASDWGGPADYLDAECGILVSPVPRAAFADRLAAAIARLAADPALRAAMGAAGAAKVRAEYDWERKVDRMLEICRDAAGPPPHAADHAGPAASLARHSS